MKASTKENLKIAALGVGSAIVLSAIVIAAAVHDVPNFNEWVSVVGWTAFIFGFLAYGLRRYLRAPRCLAVFLLALGVHLTLLIRFFPANSSDADLFFLFFSVPEAALIGVMLFYLGGIRHAERHHPSKRHGHTDHPNPREGHG